MPTIVVHRRDPHDVYIGRPSKWGNPFVVGPDGDREDVILKYTDWLLDQPALMQMIVPELRGKRLGCWCAPAPCHGDVLAHMADMIYPRG